MTPAIAPVDLVGVHLDCLALSLGLPKPEREVTVCEGRRFRWDFAWTRTSNHLPLYVAVEYCGGTWVGLESHASGRGIERDYEKAAEGQLHGWLVIFVTASMVRSGKAVELVERALRLRMADNQ
jgi:hypothetical protein